jgi:hypothetical protein
MRVKAVICLLALALASPAVAQEATVKSKIISVGLFKNGLVIIKREVLMPGAGTFRLDALPEPVHGSFWVESTAKVDVSVKMRDVEVPMHVEGGMKLQSDLAGKTVTIHFRNEKIPSVTGTLVKLSKAEQPEGLVPLERGGYVEHFWVLKTIKSRIYINPGDIAMIQTEDPDEKIVQRKPVLILNVEKAQKPSVYVSYLTNGLAWAPSYHVDISNPKTLAIEMATVIRNELVDLQDADMKLISGFPSVEFASVTSPLSARTTWTKFFQEVSGRHDAREDGIQRQQLALTNAMQPMNNFDFFARPKLDLGATPAGEGVDLHYEPIGKRTLLRDESMSLSIGKAKADYERVIEWTVGTSPVARRHGGERQGVKDEMWDVLVFKNPFKFPMTTAPAMVVENGKFNGQRTSVWTNVGEESHLRITRSLSVRALSKEEGDSKPTERVAFDDKTYSKVYLKGELHMSNHRAQPIKLNIRHAIRGVISEISGEPKLVDREESLEDVNRVHEALWTVNLAPGEEKRLSYKYSVLVYR